MNLSPERKIAGVLVPLFALRGPRTISGSATSVRCGNLSIGLHDIGFKLVQLLPINETGADNSPYNAISAMAIEPTTLHLAPSSPPDLTREDFEGALLAPTSPALRRGGVKYRQVKQLKQHILEKAFANFSAHAERKPQSGIRTHFAKTETSWLADYTFFRVLMRK